MQLKIRIGKTIFNATLENNPTADAFKKLLPLTIEMFELNRNEKYAELSQKLPINSIVPTLVESGDIMLYGDDVLVLFYKSFKTTYRYTKIGKIEQHDLLGKALGDGNVVVSISLEH